ncbi:MAG: rhodanese-like domain-containing protein [Pseudomonadota bacterium]
MQAAPDPIQPQAPRFLTRRRALGLGVAVAVTGAVFSAKWFNVLARNQADTMTPQEAHAAASRGDILLIDIRRPDEWARTGVGEGAIPIDMRREDFTDTLLAHAGTVNRHVALICARGVRSRRLSERLTDAGFTHIIDVPEGMLGSGAGPGWLAADLPVDFPTG